MIENVVLKFLKDDAVLNTLTGGNIYPDTAQVAELPVVIMTADAPNSPIDASYFFTQNLTFEIYAQSEYTAQQIRNRLYELLNKYDKFTLNDLPNKIMIREAHAVPASVSNHFPNDTTQAKEKVASFDFQYTKCA